MAILTRFRTQNNAFIIEQFDSGTPLVVIDEFLNTPAGEVWYDFPFRINGIINENIFFLFKKTSTGIKSSLPTGFKPTTPIDRNDIVNGDASDVAFADRAEVVQYLSNAVGVFSFAFASLPAGSLQFNTARIITNIGQLQQVAGEFVFSEPTLVFMIDTLILDLEGIPFRLNNQSITFWHMAKNEVLVLDSTDVFDMFVGWGTVQLINVRVAAEGIASSIFNGLDPANVGAPMRSFILCDNATFSGCREIGFMEEFEEVEIIDCQIENTIVDGITFSGPYGRGVNVRNLATRNNFGTLFAGDPSFTTPVAKFINNRMRGGLGTDFNFVVGNFSEDEALQIKANNSDSPTFVTGISKGSPRSSWTGNIGADVENTLPGIFAEETVGADTVLGASTAFAPVVTTLSIVNSDWWTDLGGGQFQFDGIKKTFDLNSKVSLGDGANKQFEVAFGITQGGPVFFIGESVMTTSVSAGGDHTENQYLDTQFEFRQFDTMQLYIRKIIGGGTDPAFQIGSTLRASLSPPI